MATRLLSSLLGWQAHFSVLDSAVFIIFFACVGFETLPLLSPKEQAGFLAFVVEDDVERAVFVDVQSQEPARVEDLLFQPQAGGRVHELAVPVVTEETVGASQTTDQQIGAAGPAEV